MKNINLTVEYGDLSSTINPELLDRQNKWDNVKTILSLNRALLILRTVMNNTYDPTTMRNLNNVWTEVEFQLQDAWGFEKNINFQRGWERPGCICPEMDNEENYGTKYRVVTEACILHGHREQGEQG